MKIGTVVKTRITGLGIYMYPHETPVKPNTTCSVMSRKNNRIFHLPYSAITPYKNVCWSCGHDVDSTNDYTCPTCHWVTCPRCGACKRPQCESDGIIILDAYAPDGWEETTGFDYEDFFEGYINQEYDYLGQGISEDVEKCYKALLNHNLEPIMVVIGIQIVSLYIENSYSEIARDIISNINVRLTYNLIDSIIFDTYSSRRSSGGCIFCGDATYDDTLCPSCANNID